MFDPFIFYEKPKYKQASAWVVCLKIILKYKQFDLVQLLFETFSFFSFIPSNRGATELAILNGRHCMRFLNKNENKLLSKLTIKFVLKVESAQVHST